MEDMSKILAALSSSNYTWRTVEGVSKETGVAPHQVVQIIESMPDKVIRSRIPDPQGRTLYTSREHYKETHSPLQRLFYQIRSTST